MKEFWVKHEFKDSAWGKRPNRINCFKTRKEAEEFAATTADGVVVELTLIETIEA